MIQSMTGYGKATVAFGEKKIHVELKSLNSKAMDLSVRIAPLYREKEMEIRAQITKALERGKVDFSLWVEKEASEMATPINAALMNNYYEQFTTARPLKSRALSPQVTQAREAISLPSLSVPTPSVLKQARLAMMLFLSWQATVFISPSLRDFTQVLML